jgi:2,3-bisphosphoglycerate-independent phosphoglycerate mutase
LKRIMQDSVAVLRGHPTNQRRISEGKTPATMLWLWGQGTAAQFPAFQRQYGLRGACISAVDIVRGLGTLLGFDIIQVPGITGYFDTNYRGKAEYALKALDDHGFVLVHIEATDEAGHMGDAQKKIQAIEDTDAKVVGPLLEGLKRRGEPFAILVVPDHPTSTELKTHVADPVPFALYASSGRQRAGAARYTESDLQGSATRFADGVSLMSCFLQQGQG